MEKSYPPQSTTVKTRFTTKPRVHFVEVSAVTSILMASWAIIISNLKDKIILHVKHCNNSIPTERVAPALS